MCKKNSKTGTNSHSSFENGTSSAVPSNLAQNVSSIGALYWKRFKKSIFWPIVCTNFGNGKNYDATFEAVPSRVVCSNWRQNEEVIIIFVLRYLKISIYSIVPKEIPKTK